MSRGFIAVATMRVGDLDLGWMVALARRVDVLPAWTPAAASPFCPLGVGVEDAPTGARIIQIPTDGVAQATGLKTGDTLIQIDETDLIGVESPVRAISETLARADCASVVALRIQRNDVILELTVRRLPK